MKTRFWRRLVRNLTRWTSIRYLQDLKRRVGALETVIDAMLTSPVYASDPTNAFNGQSGRQALFGEITGRVRFHCIVETGTFLGNSAGWMNEVTGLPVYSSEINRRFHLLARRRLAERTDVHLELGDSRELLRKLAGSPVTGQTVFFYLDAHWYESLPLDEELRLIGAHWREFVVMVDDFEVPGDAGYGFDDYGFGRSLTYARFKKIFDELGLNVYFPSMPAAKETGARSGCVVLAKKGSEAAHQLDGIGILSAASADRAAS